MQALTKDQDNPSAIQPVPRPGPDIVSKPRPYDPGGNTVGGGSNGGYERPYEPYYPPPYDDSGPAPCAGPVWYCEGQDRPEKIPYRPHMGENLQALHIQRQALYKQFESLQMDPYTDPYEVEDVYQSIRAIEEEIQMLRYDGMNN